jgi:excisionase family DNA binding protein
MAHVSTAPLTARLLTPREVAAVLRVSASMVRKLTALGELAAVRIGRLPRYEDDEVSSYLQRQRTRAEVQR